MRPALMHVSAPDGEFHIKAGGLHARAVLRAQIQRRFFHNRERYGMPNIQGMVILASASNGLPLAVMDSMEITIQRTGAATAIAARYLARRDSSVVTMCGCGNQGRIQLRAICHALPIQKAFAFGLTLEKSRAFAAIMSAELNIVVEPTGDFPAALRQSDVCVTCTPAKKALIFAADVPRGMFISAVGADSPDKQELDERLLPPPVCTATCWSNAPRSETPPRDRARAGPARGFPGRARRIDRGHRPRPHRPEEITIFDSTGTALQDVAAAVAVYRKAKAAGIGTESTWLL